MSLQSEIVFWLFFFNVAETDVTVAIFQMKNLKKKHKVLMYKS